MEGSGDGGFHPGAAAFAAALAASAFSWRVRPAIAAFMLASASRAPSPSAETTTWSPSTRPRRSRETRLRGSAVSIAATDAQDGAGAAGSVDPVRGGPRVQAVRIIADPGETLGEIDGRGGGDALHRRVGQGGDDLAGVGRARQGVERGLVLHEAGQAAQYGDVGVGLGGDGDDEAGGLALVPDDPFGDLQDREANLPHHGAVLDHAVRDGDAVAEESVGDRLAPHHRVDIGGVDAAGRHQHLGGFADRRLLGGGVSAETHEFGGQDL